VAALVSLLIAMALLGTMLQAAVQSRRQLRIERDLRQCELLQRAGIDRAAAQIARQPDYAGETWVVPAGALGREHQAHVTVRIPTDSTTPTRRIEILAEYPYGDETSIRRSFTATFTPRTSPTQEN
jgi:hypothetical protein